MQLDLKAPPGVLGGIVERTLADVAERRQAMPRTRIEAMVATADAPRPFADALRAPGLSLIAEYKPRSPSRGDIRPLDLQSIGDCATDKLAAFPDDMADPEVQSANRCLAGMLAKAEWRPDNITKPATELRACGMGWIVDFFEIEDEEPVAAPAAATSRM